MKDLINGTPTSSNWTTADLDLDDDGEYIAQAIREGNAIAVSDGSFMLGGGAAACIIEGKQFNHHRITSTASTPGDMEFHDAYRAELTGIFMVTQIVDLICNRHGITEGKITLACDGLEALRKSMSPDVSFSSLSSQFDLISAIDAAINKSPLTWHWRHVKGHQDNNQGPLDRWASLN
eukprot:2726366-Ditylum_brightwellii.AAC.1